MILLNIDVMIMYRIRLVLSFNIYEGRIGFVVLNFCDVNKSIKYVNLLIWVKLNFYFCLKFFVN